MPAQDILGRDIAAGSYVIYNTAALVGTRHAYRKKILGLVREITLDIDADGERTYTVRMNTLELPDSDPKKERCQERTTQAPWRLCVVNFVPEKFGEALGDYHA